jgi:hypothetical protein
MVKGKLVRPANFKNIVFLQDVDLGDGNLYTVSFFNEDLKAHRRRIKAGAKPIEIRRQHVPNRPTISIPESTAENIRADLKRWGAKV